MNFYNISNHPSAEWSEVQREAAKALVDGGYIIDLAFPNVDPRSTSKEVQDMAWGVMEQVPSRGICMIQGEAGLAFGLIMVALIRRCSVYAATTERKVVESVGLDGVTVKTATFEFVGFRDLHGCGSHALTCLIQEGL